MVLIDQNELPQPNEKEGGREGGRKWKSKRDWKGKSRRNSLPFLPWGVQCVGGVLYVSLASVSPVFHLRKSLKPNEVPAEEFLNPAKVCVFLCSTHLLLIKQWQAVKMLFDRNCGNLLCLGKAKKVHFYLRGWSSLSKKKVALSIAWTTF